MIQIYMREQLFYVARMALDHFHVLMTDDAIRPDEFIPIPLEWGKGYIRKMDVCSYCDYEGEETATK